MPSPPSTTPTSSKSSRSASATVCLTSRWSFSKEAAWRIKSTANHSPSTRRRGSSRRWPARWMWPTAVGSFTATSSRRTSSWPATGRRRLPTLAWSSGWRPTPPRRERGRFSARPATWPGAGHGHREGRPRRRPIRARRHALRDAHRPAAVPRVINRRHARPRP